jgi:hypothetical protein
MSSNSSARELSGEQPFTPFQSPSRLGHRLHRKGRKPHMTHRESLSGFGASRVKPAADSSSVVPTPRYLFPPTWLPSAFGASGGEEPPCRLRRSGLGERGIVDRASGLYLDFGIPPLRAPVCAPGRSPA